MWIDHLCREDNQRLRESMTKTIVVRYHGSKSIVFFVIQLSVWTNLTTHQPPHMIGHPQLSLKCRLPNCISFDVFDRCFCKVETRACETLLGFAKRLGGLAVTNLPGPRVHLIRPWCHHLKRHKAKLHRSTLLQWHWRSSFRPNNVWVHSRFVAPLRRRANRS